MKKIVSILIISIFALTLSLSASATDMPNEIPSERLLPRLVDDANLLTDYEEKNLLAKLDEISERQQMDIVVVTVDSVGNRTPESFADDFFDYFGYGFGSNADGILLLVSMEYRDWHISTCGYGITAITDAGIDYISDEFLSDLSDGYYYDAFVTYAECCDEFVTEARNGRPYDIGHMPKGEYPWFMFLAVGFVIAVIIAFITVNVFKGQLKTVKLQNSATSYIRPGTFNVTNRNDMFLFHNISRAAKPESSSSGGGSSTHTSSSGRSHGGGGGKF